MKHETDTIDRLFLELSQFTTATTSTELRAIDLLRSANAIAKRKGEGTNWEGFNIQLDKFFADLKPQCGATVTQTHPIQ